MKLHHSKHHQAYVNGLNAAEEAYSKSTSTKEKIALQSALKFNGGGMSDHRFLGNALFTVTQVISTTRSSGRIFLQKVSTVVN